MKIDSGSDRFKHLLLTSSKTYTKDLIVLLALLCLSEANRYVEVPAKASSSFEFYII